MSLIVFINCGAVKPVFEDGSVIGVDTLNGKLLSIN